MLRVSLLLGLLAVMCISAPQAPAAIIFSIEMDPAVNAGSSAFIGVFAHSIEGDGIRGFNLPIDVDPAGSGLPPGVTFNATPIQNVFLGNSGTLDTSGFATQGQPPGSPNVDGIAQVSGSTFLTLTATPQKLFDLVLDTSLTTPNGTYSVNIVRNFFLFDVDSMPVVTDYSVAGPGSFTVTASAVPEPGSMLLCGLIGTAVVARRMRRKNKNKLVPDA